MDVVIPALNEEESIVKVVRSIPSEIVRNIIVVDNGSTDSTAQSASNAGAMVLSEEEKGYGAACLKGINHLESLASPPDRIAFLDGDYSDFPEDLSELNKAMIENDLDMVLGERVSLADRGSLTIQQRIGNRIATGALKALYGYSFKDLGPMRIITRSALQQLSMKDRNYGWTVEMQIKASKEKMKVAEVPVRYRQRIGKSKVSGTVKGSVLAGYKIILTLIRYSR